MERFKNKIVVITGAGSGIGRSTALRLDAEGAHLLMVDRNQEDLDDNQRDAKK
jgi:meso-butanediol dehydrogenase/(S,S)-butanediol dehydrogenase/diacetyl reductase